MEASFILFFFAIKNKILSHEGVAGLYRGIAPPVAGVALFNSILFGSYSMCRRFLQPNASIELTRAQIFACGRTHPEKIIKNITKKRGEILRCNSVFFLFVFHLCFFFLFFGPQEAQQGLPVV